MNITATGPRDLLNVFILVVFAISQPILSLLGNNTLFFIVRRSDYAEVLLLVLILCVALPALIVLIAFLAQRVLGTLGGLLVTALIVLCLGLLIAPWMTQVSGWDGALAVLLSLAIALILTFIYFRMSQVRVFVSYLLPAIVIFPLAFLLNDSLQKAMAISDPSASPHQITAPANVVMIVFDSMPLVSILDRDRNVDGERLPNFAQLTQGASWYRNASTPNESTWWAVPSALTGRELSGVMPMPVHNIFPKNLFTAFGHQMELHVTENISRLCPDDLCQPEEFDSGARYARIKSLLQDVTILYQHSIYPEVLAEELPRINETLGGFTQGNIKQKSSEVQAAKNSPKALLEGFVDSIQQSDKPQLYFLHVLAPHAPWQYTPSGKEYGAGHFAKIHGLLGIEKKWGKDRWAMNLAYQRHLMQVGFVDHMLGRVIARLRAQGLYDDTMLIVLSDHGNSYRTGDFHRRVSEDNKGDIVGVPLIIKYPNQRVGVIDDRNVSLVDLLPTIFDQLGVQTEWSFEGGSLLGDTLPKREGKQIKGLDQTVFKLAEDYYQHSGSLANKFALLATGRPIDSAFNISLHPQLNGRKLADLPVIPSKDKFFIHDPQQFDDVDLSSAYLPVYVSGKAPKLELSTPIAVALNGKIITVTRVFSDRPRRRHFAAMIPASQFRDGSNTLSLHRVQIDRDQYTLYDSTLHSFEQKGR